MVTTPRHRTTFNSTSNWCTYHTSVQMCKW